MQCVESAESDLRPFITFGYPEVTPALLIIKSGHLTVSYRNQDHYLSESCCFTFIEEPSRIVVSKEFSVVRIVFKATGVVPLIRLTGLSAEELISRPVIRLSEFMNPKLKMAIARTQETKDQEDLETLIHTALDSALTKSQSHLLELGKHPFLGSSIDNLCDMLCCTPRTLQRWFKAEMGISPKYFLRLLRFKHTLQHLGARHPDHPIAVANALGYYDQNHLIKEVQHFTHTTPGKLSFDHYLPTQLPSG